MFCCFACLFLTSALAELNFNDPDCWCRCVKKFCSKVKRRPFLLLDNSKYNVSFLWFIFLISMYGSIISFTYLSDWLRDSSLRGSPPQLRQSQTDRGDVHASPLIVRKLPAIPHCSNVTLICVLGTRNKSQH